MYQKKHNMGYHPIAIALDTKGPEIRTGLLAAGANAEVNLTKGSKVTVTTDDDYQDKCDERTIWLDYKNIVNVVKAGFRIYVDDGLISLRVLQVNGDKLLCEVENDGQLGSKKGKLCRGWLYFNLNNDCFRSQLARCSCGFASCVGEGSTRHPVCN